MTRETIELAVLKVAHALPERFKLRSQWQDFSEDQLWSEMVASILGSAVSYEQAIRALTALQAADYLRPNVLEDSETLAIAKCLANSGYRFPNTRARCIAQT